MARRISIVPGELHHLYNRGTEKRAIFLTDGDYLRFQVLLYLCNSEKSVRIDDLLSQGRTLRELFEIERGETLVDICAYCLMPNHIHLLAHEKREGGTSTFMQKMMTAYTMYFNTKFERTGALFQGKYKASHVANDRYLKYLLSYIHLNPVKLIEPQWKETGIRDHENARDYLRKYNFSSFIDYGRGVQRPEKCIVAMDVLKEYFDFQTPTDFSEQVHDWLTYRDS